MLTKTSEQASAICFLLSEDAFCITATDLSAEEDISNGPGNTVFVVLDECDQLRATSRKKGEGLIC